MSGSIKNRISRLEKLHQGNKPHDEDNFVLSLGVDDVESYRLPDGTLDWMKALNDSTREAWADYDLRKDD